MAFSSQQPQIALYYRILFLYIEPASALAGAIAAAAPATYLTLLDPNNSTSASNMGITLRLLGQSAVVGTAINQLANLYLFFALAEALVLRAAHVPAVNLMTASSAPPGSMGKQAGTLQRVPLVSVWRALLIPMLVADIGHLVAGYRMGWEQYWQVSSWDAMAMGSIGFVYVGALSRIAFLCGIGVGDGVSYGLQASDAIKKRL